MGTVVALDTSALMLPIEMNLRLFDELERLLGSVETILPVPVERELEVLKEEGGQTGRAAAVGHTLAEERCDRVETATSVADDAVLELVADGVASYFVTADRELAVRGRRLGMSVITPRSGGTLEIEGD